MNHTDIVRSILGLVVMLAGALAGGTLIRKVGLPGVLGELLAGVLLGPTVMGTVFPTGFQYLFPGVGPVFTCRDLLVRLGLVCFLFYAGLEVRLSDLRQSRTAVMSTSLLGVLIPFILGFGAARLIYQPVGSHGHSENLIFPLVIAAAMAISALPVIARILIDLKLLHTETGALVMACATIDDLIGWCLFAGILHVARPEVASGRDFWESLGLLTLVCAYGLVSLRTTTQSSSRKRAVRVPGAVRGLMITLLIAAALLEVVGVHGAMGAFFAGVAVGSLTGHNSGTLTLFRPLILSFFTPLYFVSIGLKANFAANFDAPLVLGILGISCIGKVGGATLGAWLGKRPPRQALAIGFAMNARGAMGIVLATIALDNQFIDHRVFVALVVMAFVTTLLSGPIMQRLMVDEALS